MDHSHHMHAADMGHDMPMARCKMNMLWNTDIIDTCIVFRSWHIHNYTQFVFSILAIVMLGVLFEFLRVLQRKLDVHIAQSLQGSGNAATRGRNRSNSRGGSASPNGGGNSEEMGLLGGKLLKIRFTGTPVPPIYRAFRAAVYGSTVFLSFFLMLVFMTYNAYFIFATVFGATLGHYVFGSTINVDAILGGSGGDKGMACH